MKTHIVDTEKVKMYYVGSNENAPEQLHFSLEEAQENKHYYIDVFDKDGIAVTSFKLVDDEYTSFF